MGYISYTYSFVKKRLEKYEQEKVVTKDMLDEAKILLKMIEDVYDEGYVNSYNLMENDFHGVTRLRKFLTDHQIE